MYERCLFRHVTVFRLKNYSNNTNRKSSLFALNGQHLIIIFLCCTFLISLFFFLLFMFLLQVLSMLQETFLFEKSKHNLVLAIGPISIMWYRLYWSSKGTRIVLISACMTVDTAFFIFEAIYMYMSRSIGVIGFIPNCHTDEIIKAVYCFTVLYFT